MPKLDRRLRLARSPGHAPPSTQDRAFQRSRGASVPGHLDPIALRARLGNAQLSRLLRTLQDPPARIQAKLSVSEPGDPSEREADAVAEQVVRHQEQEQVGSLPGGGPRPAEVARPPALHRMIQRVESSFPPNSEEALEKEKGVQRQADGHGIEAGPEVEEALSSDGGGTPLPGPTLARMESSFGVGLDHVRVHADGRAADLSRKLGAEAFTYGSHIYFGAGKFDDRTRSGNELLAHELTHTIQQQGVQRRAIQRRGGATVGTLAIRTNVVGAGLTDGHAWLSYTPNGGAQTTYGTWGNKPHIGLNRDLELPYPYAASRSTALDATDHSSLVSFASANDSWGYINNCASFAARGWRAVAGESLSYTSLGIPNPSALGSGIVAANGGATGVLPATPAAPPSSGGSSI